MVHLSTLSSIAMLAMATSATPLPADLSPRQLLGGASSSCKPIMVIFARGTTEVGDLGTVAGPPFQTALNAKFPGQVSMQGVPAPAYPADVPGYLAGGSATGASKMAEMVKDAATNCPDARIIMSGYRYVRSERDALLAFADGSDDAVRAASLSTRRARSWIARPRRGWRARSSLATLITRSRLRTSRT